MRATAVLEGTSRASTSTVGTLLMVALAFLVAMGALATVFLPVVTPPPPAPVVAFGFEYANNGSTDALVVEHRHGEDLSGAHLSIDVRGAIPATAEGTYGWDGPELAGGGTVSSGSSVSLDRTTVGDGTSLDLDEARIAIVWRSGTGDHEALLDRWRGPEHDAAGGTPTPTPDPTDPGHAYVDANGNGAWDAGIDTKIDDADIEDGIYDAGSEALVIPESVGPISANKIDLDAAAITVEVDLTGTGDQDVTVTAGSGVLAIEGVTVDSATGRQITLRGESGVRANGTTVDSGAAITVKSNSGELHLSDGMVDATEKSGANVQLTSYGDMYLESTTLTTTAGGAADASLQVEDTSTLYVDGATIDDGDDTLTYSPEDIAIDGSPSSGSVA